MSQKRWLSTIVVRLICMRLHAFLSMYYCGLSGASRAVGKKNRHRTVSLWRVSAVRCSGVWIRYDLAGAVYCSLCPFVSGANQMRIMPRKYTEKITVKAYAEAS